MDYSLLCICSPLFFFPAFVLAFAYPTRVITIFTFTGTFLILSTVYLTTFIRKGFNMKGINDAMKNRYYARCIKILYSTVLMILLLYFFLFIFALLYSLVIGRASVVSSAPLALLSLLLSILISLAAWVMKSTMLNNDNGKSDHSRDKNEEVDGSYNIEQNTNTKEAIATQDDKVNGHKSHNSVEDETKKVNKNGEVTIQLQELHNGEDCGDGGVKKVNVDVESKV